VRPSERLVLAGLVVLGVVTAVPGRPAAETATEQLRPAIDEIVRILEDRSLRGPAATRERRAAVRPVMDRVIDFPDASMRVLGPHWRARTDAERREFVILFSDLVSYSYTARIEPYAGERVLYVGEVAVEGVTLVSNYRSQFNTIIRTSSYEELVSRIKARLTELAAPSRP
jgi:phospholipid transport system substrate-binding protein